MKNSAKILILAIAFLALQACGPKANEAKTEVAAVPATTVKALTIEQKRVKLEKERVARANRLKADREELAKTSPYYTDAKGNRIYYKAELEPVYTGGEEAMTEYLNKNLKFPDEAFKNEIEGTVLVDFVVDNSGTVKDVEVTDSYNTGVDQSLRDEAYRVVSTMPRWKPGSQRGKNVAVKYSLPINFVIP